MTRLVSSLALIGLLVACGGGEPPKTEPAGAGEPAAVDHSKMDHSKMDHSKMGHPPADAPPAGAAFEAPPANAKVSFVGLTDGAELKNPIKLTFAVEGLTVKPAGELAAGTGHHHLLIDVPATPVGETVPKDDQHMHFGAGQTEAELNLGPGEHTLTLQFADGLHRSYGPTTSATVKVKVLP